MPHPKLDFEKESTLNPTNKSHRAGIERMRVQNTIEISVGEPHQSDIYWLKGSTLPLRLYAFAESILLKYLQP